MSVYMENFDFNQISNINTLNVAIFWEWLFAPNSITGLFILIYDFRNQWMEHVAIYVDY